MTTTIRNRALEETPARALTFLRGVGMNPDIRATLSSCGYDDEANATGWSLLQKTSGYAGTGTTGNPVGDAIKQLSDWNGVGFHRIHAALAHLHPEQEAYVFKDLEAATGVASVIAVATLLDRIDDLDGTGPGAAARKDSADADKKAIATLAIRGITASERTRLRGLVKTAQSAPMPSVESASAAETAIVALKAWYDDWAETAKAVLTKRGDLIKLGLAKRISRTADQTPAPTVTDPATPPGPVATPPAPVAAPPAPAPSPSAPMNGAVIAPGFGKSTSECIQA